MTGGTYRSPSQRAPEHGKAPSPTWLVPEIGQCQDDPDGESDQGKRKGSHTRLRMPVSSKAAPTRAKKPKMATNPTMSERNVGDPGVPRMR